MLLDRIMTPGDLRAWQVNQGYTHEEAYTALGVSRAAYLGWLSGKSRATGEPIVMDRRTALACAALAAGVDVMDVATGRQT